MRIRCPSPRRAERRILATELITLRSAQLLFRVGKNGHEPTHWDSRGHTDYRFSPLVVGSTIVPVLYLAGSPDAAILETVLRYTPSGGGGSVFRSDLEGRYIVEVTLTRELQLFPLAGPEAKALGENVGVAIASCNACDYAITRRWAAAIHELRADADGIGWISHQHGSDWVYLLWPRGKGDPDAPLSAAPPRSLLEPVVTQAVRGLCSRAGHLWLVD